MTTPFVLQSTASSKVHVELDSPNSSYIGCYSTTPYTIRLSAEDAFPHKVQLYAQNSRSAPYQQPQNKWSHLIPQWRFVDLSGNYIDSIQMPSSGGSTQTLGIGNLTIGSTFIIGVGATASSGVTGEGQFYYVDDRQTLSGSGPVTIWATVDYSDYPVHYDLNTHLSAVPGFANSVVLASASHYVSGLNPERIKVTRNGKDPLFNYYWVDTEIPLFFTLHGRESIVQTISASKDPIIFDIPYGKSIQNSLLINPCENHGSIQEDVALDTYTFGVINNSVGYATAGTATPGDIIFNIEPVGSKDLSSYAALQFYWLQQSGSTHEIDVNIYDFDGSGLLESHNVIMNLGGHSTVTNSNGIQWEVMTIPFTTPANLTNVTNIRIIDQEGSPNNIFLDHVIALNYPVSSDLTNFGIQRGVFNLPYSQQEWSPSAFTQFLSATDLDDFSIGGYFYNTLSLSAESLSTVVTAVTEFNYASSFAVNLTASSSQFDVLEYDDYNIRRFNESWDATRKMTSLIFAPHIKENETFWNGYISGVFGGKETPDGKAFGRQAYEKIANFVSNQADIESCGIDQIYSLANSTDVPIDDYGFQYPAELRRIMDIVSVNQQKLWGARCTCKQNIENEYKTYVSGGEVKIIESYCERCGLKHGGNRGPLFEGLTYTVTAGVPFVIKDKYRNDQYSLVNPPPSCFTQITTGVDPCSGLTTIETCLTTYPLSAAYWWVLPGVYTTTPSYSDFTFSAVGRFCFYTYIDIPCQKQIEGLINWDDPYTTLNENLSTAEDWYGQDQAIEKMLSYVIHKGLGLIDE